MIGEKTAANMKADLTPKSTAHCWRLVAGFALLGLCALDWVVVHILRGEKWDKYGMLTVLVALGVAILVLFTESFLKGCRGIAQVISAWKNK